MATETLQVGDKVAYYPADEGRPGAIQAEVTRLRDDGTIDIVYPHFRNAGVMATAQRVRLGTSAYQYSSDKAVLTPAPDVGAGLAAAGRSLAEAQAEVERLTGELAAAAGEGLQKDARIAELATEVERLTGELASLTAPLAKADKPNKDKS